MSDLTPDYTNENDFLPENYDFDLPECLIAQYPAPKREDARMLVLDRASGSRFHKNVCDLADIVRGDEVVVVNDTRVIPARLVGRRQTGGKVELLVIPDRLSVGSLSGGDNSRFRCLSKASGKLRPGEELLFGDQDVVRIDEVCDNGVVVVDFRRVGGAMSLMSRYGQVPLPPYIQRDRNVPSSPADHERYQTIFASQSGAVAAPTAGLHLTHGILDSLKNRGVPVARVTLHVGPGTFLPIRAANLRDHTVLPEFASISSETASYLNDARHRGRRILAVGTTTVRTLESFIDENGQIGAGDREVALTIRPGYRFRAIAAMLTNFHLPRSSLLVLVSVFAGRSSVLDAYSDAVARGYRFYSYGDAMLIGDYNTL